jgi:histidine triad (HIT) family protein
MLHEDEAMKTTTTTTTTTITTITKWTERGTSQNVKKPLPPNLMIPPSQTIFAKIAAGKVFADRVYEDEHVCAFKDIDPQAPQAHSHILIIAKKLAIGQVCCLFVILSKIFFVPILRPLFNISLSLLLKYILILQFSQASETDATELGHLMLAAPKVADKLCLDSYRLVINQGPGAQQSINYLDVHLLSGRKMRWPPG